MGRNFPNFPYVIWLAAEGVLVDWAAAFCIVVGLVGIAVLMKIKNVFDNSLDLIAPVGWGCACLGLMFVTDRWADTHAKSMAPFGFFLILLGLGGLGWRIRVWKGEAQAETDRILMEAAREELDIEALVQELSCTPEQAKTMLTWAEGNKDVVIDKLRKGLWQMPG